MNEVRDLLKIGMVTEVHMNFKKITIALDMHGCPNRCKHCWLGHSPNGRLTIEDLRDVSELFRPYTDCLEVEDWYREPDFADNYKEMYTLCHNLSDVHADHYELISVWRIVRDPGYAKWLALLGLKAAQLTIFGDREKTDFYTGRKGAYDDILRAIEILLAHGISPRLQFFLNKDTLHELPFVEKLIAELDLENRCRAIGGEFSFFLHQGSCDGENERFYDIWVTPEDLERIPSVLAEYTLKHFGKKQLQEVFGTTEKELFQKLLADTSTASYVSDSPVFFIDKDYNVYPNVTALQPAWRLGNLKTDGIRNILKNYVESNTLAMHTRMTVPIYEIVATQGDPLSERLFVEEDYIELLVNRYCRQLGSL